MASGLEGSGQLYEEEEEKREGSDRQDAVGRTRPGTGGGSEQTSGTSDTFASNASGLSLGETIARSARQRSDVWFPLEMEADTSNGEEQMIAERDSTLTGDPDGALSQDYWPPQPGSSAQLDVQDSLLSPGLPLLVTALSGEGAIGSALMQRSVQQPHSELEFACLRESMASRDFTLGGFTTSPEVEKMSLSDSSSTGAVTNLHSSGSAGLSASRHLAAASPRSLPSASELQAGWSAYGEADSSVFRSLTQHAISPGADSAETSPRERLSEHSKWPGLGSGTRSELSLSQHPIAGASFDERRAGPSREPSYDSERQEGESRSLSLGSTDDEANGAQNEAGMQRERYLQATRLAYLGGQEEPPADDAVLARSHVGAELSKVAADDSGCRFAGAQVGSASEAGSLTRDVIGGNADSDTDAPSVTGPVASVVLTEEDEKQISAIKHLVLRGTSMPAQSFVPEGKSRIAFESVPQVKSSDCDANRRCWGQSYDRSDVAKQSPKDVSRASIRHKTMALAASFSRTACVTDTWLESSLLVAGGELEENRRSERSERSVPSGAEPDDVNIDGPDAGTGVEMSGNERSSPPTHGFAVALALSTAGAFSLGQLGDISAEQDGDALASARSCGPSHTGNQTPALSTARSQASLEVDNYTPPWTGTGNQEFDIERRIPVYLRNLGIEQPPTMTGILDGRGPLCERDYSPSELTTIKDFGLSSASEGALSNTADGSFGRGSGYSLRSELGRSTSLVLDSDSSVRLSSSLTRTRTRATNDDSEAAPGESPEGSGKSRSRLLLSDDVDKGDVQQEVKARAHASSEQEADTVMSVDDLDNRTGDRSSTPSRFQDRMQEAGISGLAGYSGPAKSSESERPSQRAHGGYFYGDEGADAVGDTWPDSQYTEQAENRVSDLMISGKTMLEIQTLLRDAGTYDRNRFDSSCESDGRDILQSLRTDGRTGPSSGHELQTGSDRTVILDIKAKFDKTSTFAGKIRSTEHDYQSSYFPLGQDGHGSVERPSVAKGAAKSSDASSPFAQPAFDLPSARKSDKNTERQTLAGSARHEPEGCSGAATGTAARPRAPSNPSLGDESVSSGGSSRADPTSGSGSEGAADDVMARVRAILRDAAEHGASREDSDDGGGRVDAGPAERRGQGADGLPGSAGLSAGAAPPWSRPWLQAGAAGGDSTVGSGPPLTPPPPPPPSLICADVAPARLRREADAASVESAAQRLAVLLSDRSPDDLAESIVRRADEEEEISRELSLRMKLARGGVDPAWRNPRGGPSSVQREDPRSLVTMGHGLQEQSETDSESESVTLTRVSHILSEKSGSQCLASLDLSGVEPEPLNVLQRAHLRIASQLQRLSEEPFDSSGELASAASWQQPSLPDAPRQLVPGEQPPSQQWPQSRISDRSGVRGDVSVEQPLREERSPSRLSEKSAAGHREDQSRGSSGLPNRPPEDRSRASNRTVGLTGGERHASYEAWVTDRSFRATTPGSVPDFYGGIYEISDSGRPNDKVSGAELIEATAMAGEKTPSEGQDYRRPISSITFTSRKRGDSSPSTRSPSPTPAIAAQTRVSAASPERQPSSRSSPVHFEQPAGLRANTGVDYLTVANTAPSKDFQTAATLGGEDKSGYSDHGSSRLSARSALTHMHIKLSPAKAGHSPPPTGTSSSSHPSCTVVAASKNNTGSDAHLGGAMAQAARGRASPSGLQGSEVQTIQLRPTAGQEDTRSFQRAWPAGPTSYGTHEGPPPPVTHGPGNPVSFSFTFVSSAAAQGTADQPLVCPYRPAGSSELYYVPAVVGRTGKSSPCGSQSTAESSHPGSNNALPPTFPAAVLGSRDRHAEPSQDAGVPSSTPAGPSHVSWQPPHRGDSDSACRATAQHNIRYLSELSGWTSGSSAERGAPMAIHHLDGARRARSAWVDPGPTPDAGSAWRAGERPRSAAPTVGDFGESPVAYERAGRPDRRAWQESSGEGTERHARRRRFRSTGVGSVSPGAGGGATGPSEPSLDELWGRFTVRQRELRALDGADEATLLRKLEELARRLRRSRAAGGEGARSTPTEGTRAGAGTGFRRSARLDEPGDRRHRSLELEETWSSGSRTSGGRMTPSSLAGSAETEETEEHGDASSVAETSSTIDTVRLVRAFGPGRVRLSSPALRSLRDAVLRQRDGPGTYGAAAKQGRRSGAAERDSRPPRALSSSGAATDSTWEGSHVAPPLPAKSRGRQRSKGVQAGDLELVPGVKGRTRDVGVTFPSPAPVAPAAGPRGEPTSGSPVRASDREGAVAASAARRSRHDKQSRVSRKRQRPILKPVSWFVPLDRRTDRDSDASRQGVKENVSGHEGGRYEGSGTWHSPGWDGPAQGGSGSAVGGGGGGSGGASGVLSSRPPLREMQQHDVEEELVGGPLRSLELITLQEALHMNRPAFVYRSRERVKRLQLMTEERRVQGVWQQERERLFGWGTRGRRRRHGQRQSNSGQTHPVFDNLFLAKKRVVPKKEAFVRSKSLYEKLPEIRRRREEEKKHAEYQSNRLKADNFQRKVTNKLLGRSTAWE